MCVFYIGPVRDPRVTGPEVQVQVPQAGDLLHAAAKLQRQRDQGRGRDAARHRRQEEVHPLPALREVCGSVIDRLRSSEQQM